MADDCPLKNRQKLRDKSMYKELFKYHKLKKSSQDYFIWNCLKIDTRSLNSELNTEINNIFYNNHFIDLDE